MQLPEEAKKFDKINKEFKSIIQRYVDKDKEMPVPVYFIERSASAVVLPFLLPQQAERAHQGTVATLPFA